jgi:glycosyltransferase involved in cell wall biosynthesis
MMTSTQFHKNKRALIIAPNMGLSLRGGGGVKVTLAQAETLAEAGFRVILTALTGYSLDTLDAIHNTKLSVLKSQIDLIYLFSRFKRKNQSFKNYNEDIIKIGQILVPLPLLWVISSYNIAKVLKDVTPSIIIFNDDVPIIYEDFKSIETKSILYANFPYATKYVFNLSLERGSEETLFIRKFAENSLRGVVRNIIYVNRKPPVDKIICNSTITAKFISKMWNMPASSIQVIYPPVEASDKALSLFPSNREKEIIEWLIRNKARLVLSIGAIQPNKRYEDVLYALARIRSLKFKYIIIGHLVNLKYYRKLIKITHELNLSDRVKILTDVPGSSILKFLIKASIIVHAARFEPFGIAVVEGMSFGAVPIVYSGPLSGPWNDIIQKGRYGIGFKDIEELVTVIEEILTNNNLRKYYMEKAIERSRAFSKTKFKEKFAHVIKK